MQISDLIRYNHLVRGLYLDTMAKMDWSEVVSWKGLSFDSMRNVFLHLTVVEDRWISYIIPGRSKQWVDPDFSSFNDIESLRNYAEEVKQRTETYLADLTDKELNRQVTVYWGAKPTELPVEKGLTHMVLEDMIHYGELSAAMWQMGWEAPYSGFWKFGTSEPFNVSRESKKEA
jgi:uncharacterized damage-inducible protein DinB